jgi:hypothetical protein
MAFFEGNLAKRRKERRDVVRAIYLEKPPAFELRMVARIHWSQIAEHPLWIKAFGDEKPNPNLINSVRGKMMDNGEI